VTRRGALFVLLALALACAGGPAPRDHFYRLSVPAPAPRPAPVFAGSVEVDRFRADALTGGVRIVQRRNGSRSELEPYAYQQWADPPTLQLQNALGDYLRRANAARLVVSPEMRTRVDYSVLGRIVELEHATGDGSSLARVELELTVVRERGRAIVLQQVYREERPAAGAGVAPAVDAASAAVGAIFERFLADAAAALAK
jgi:ABC-type uncharacterized transport system auxiliary subunit